MLARDLAWFAVLSGLAVLWAFTRDFAAAHPGLELDPGDRWTLVGGVLIGPFAMLDPAWGSMRWLVLGSLSLVATGIFGRARVPLRRLGYAGLVLWFALGLLWADAML